LWGGTLQKCDATRSHHTPYGRQNIYLFSTINGASSHLSVRALSLIWLTLYSWLFLWSPHPTRLFITHYPIPYSISNIYTQKRTITWAYPILKPKSMVDPKPTNLPTIRKVKDLATCWNGNVTMTRKVMTFSDDYVMEVGLIASHVIHISSVFLLLNH